MAVSSLAVEVVLSEMDRERALAADVREGLAGVPKRIPAKWLYDRRGCSLFEQITGLDEYYPTRAERAALAGCVGQLATLTRAQTLAEIGSGTSQKTRLLIDALRRLGTLRSFVAYDVAEPTLRKALECLSSEYEGLELAGVVGDFERHLSALPDLPGRMVAFLGGTVGNLSPESRRGLFAELATGLKAGEWFLLGADLVKDVERIMAAYDDPAGITAAFESNSLCVVNRALSADFDLSRFDYVARWDHEEEAVDMALRSRGSQRVVLGALDMVVDLADGELIHTETSAKFHLEGLLGELRRAGLEPVGHWEDPAGDFSVILSRRASQSHTAGSGLSPGVVDEAKRAGRSAGASGQEGGSGEAEPPTGCLESYLKVRANTESLAAPLSAEDQTVQTMPDVSPTKWHRGHVTWFFERFVLLDSSGWYRRPYDERYLYLFNSYYDAAGPRHARAERGLLSRPGVGEVTAYRQVVDEAMYRLFDQGLSRLQAGLVELGLHHEQQHQELILMDIKHVLGTNPLRPAYRPSLSVESPDRASGTRWVDHPGGLVEVGCAPGAIGRNGEPSPFSFDNENPRHKVWLEPFGISDRLVSEGEWTEFMLDGGYERSELWLSDGWASIRANGQHSPLYWEYDHGEWSVYTLGGPRPLRAGHPVIHLSYYEADAFARWAGARLPSEAEWEVAAADRSTELRQLFGEAWQWTSAAYLPYPGFLPAPGIVGEYNGKFMVNQHVLRGSSCVTPEGHARLTYRNFLPPSARWAFSGLRLARAVPQGA